MVGIDIIVGNLNLESELPSLSYGIGVLQSR